MVLVTGASGFLGQHLIKYLSAKGLELRALYNKHKPENELLSLSNVSWERYDLLDVYDVEQALQGVTDIYHCAAVVSFNPKRWDEMLHFNTESTANIVNQALEQGIRKMIYVSSVAALGRDDEKKGPITEEAEWEESGYNSVYGKSKYMAELEVWRGIAEGLDAVIINPGIILGPGDWNDGSANLMKVVYNEFPFYTEGVNAWVDVQDVVRVTYMLMQSGVSGERFILNEDNRGYREIFNMMADAIGKKHPSIKAGPLMTSLVARLSMLKRRLFGGPSTITLETARNAQKKCYYANDKLPHFFPSFSYTPMETTINTMAQAFLRDIKK
ncbi:MAG: NAD-dependent epimerase/dehydratase family protein [Flavipsychrobacter sp.]